MRGTPKIHSSPTYPVPTITIQIYYLLQTHASSYMALPFHTLKMDPLPPIIDNWNISQIPQVPVSKFLAVPPVENSEGGFHLINLLQRAREDYEYVNTESLSFLKFTDQRPPGAQ